MNPNEMTLEALEAYLNGRLAGLTAKADLTPEDYMRISLMDIALHTPDPAERLKVCRRTVERLLAPVQEVRIMEAN